MSPAADIDWDALRGAARAAAAHAYAPYSHLRVGAAALTDDGRVVAGCNVENASYGLTLCAECGLVSSLHASGGGRLVAVVIVGGPDADHLEPLAPCGRCRQILHEHGGGALMVDSSAARPRPLRELLPEAFGPPDLPA